MSILRKPRRLRVDSMSNHRPQRIALALDGVEEAKAGPDGNMIVKTAAADTHSQRPRGVSIRSNVALGSEVRAEYKIRRSPRCIDERQTLLSRSATTIFEGANNESDSALLELLGGSLTEIRVSRSANDAATFS